jgi:hypothetical protein
MHLPLGVDQTDTTNPTTSSFAQVNGKHAERLVLANTIHLLSPAHNRETRRGTVPRCGEKHTQMRSTVCGSELYNTPQ